MTEWHCDVHCQEFHSYIEQMLHFHFHTIAQCKWHLRLREHFSFAGNSLRFFTFETSIFRWHIRGWQVTLISPNQQRNSHWNVISVKWLLNCLPDWMGWNNWTPINWEEAEHLLECHFIVRWGFLLSIFLDCVSHPHELFLIIFPFIHRIC